MNGSVPHAKRLAGRERYARITRPFPGCCDGEEESQRRGISGRGVEEKNSMDVAKILAVSLREIYRNRLRNRIVELSETPSRKMRDFIVRTRGGIELLNGLDSANGKRDWESETMYCDSTYYLFDQLELGTVESNGG